MWKISILILCMTLLVGCAGLQAQREPETNFVELMQSGVRTANINNEIVIKALIKDFPAERAGIQRGDILVSADGDKLKNSRELAYLLDNKHRGDHVLLAINRNGKQINFDIELIVMKASPTSIAIRDMLYENKKVSLAVIISEVKNLFPNTQIDWADSMRNNLQSERESGLLSAYGYADNFSIVDRSRLKQVLDEFQFNQVGFVSDKLRVKIGEMTGATHILDISFSRFPNNDHRNGFDDVSNARLIAIESGKVLAVDRATTHR